MDILELQELIDSGLSQREIGLKLNKSQCSVRHWLRKYGLKTHKHGNNMFDECDNKKCTKCLMLKPRSEYYNYNKISSWCKQCLTDDVINRQRAFKVKCVEYKGSKCSECGYNKYIGALEFHHLDPSQKDFEMSRYKLSAFSDIVKKELDKCILVCSNCHKEIHGTVAQR